MRVERFSLFFGPLILKVRRGETEYGIGPIPLGGYVKITGMNPREELPDEVAPRAYYNQPVWKRIFVIVAGPVVNIAIAFVLIWALFLANGQSVPTKRIATIQKSSPAAVGAATGRSARVGRRRDRQPGSAARTAWRPAACAGAQVNGCLAATPAR